VWTRYDRAGTVVDIPGWERLKPHADCKNKSVI
jgi:hypothetical protein